MTAPRRWGRGGTGATRCKGQARWLYLQVAVQPGRASKLGRKLFTGLFTVADFQARSPECPATSGPIGHQVEVRGLPVYRPISGMNRAYPLDTHTHHI